MAGFYGVRKDFGLQSQRVALPEVTGPTTVYNKAMPGFTSEERVRKKTATFATAASPSQGDKEKTSWTKKVRGLFKNKRRVSGGGGSAVPHSSSVDHILSSSTGQVGISGAKSSEWIIPYWEGETKGAPPQPYGEQPLPTEEDNTGPPVLIRLTLRPKNAGPETESRRVTLRRKATGFGLHLSGGLPPLTVTYVEPGGEAEVAGVDVGDVVLEVNGEDCHGRVEIAKVMELKALIQEVKIHGKSKAAISGSLETEGSDSDDGEPAGISVDDAAWQRIKARQLQDDVESQDSSPLELTHIDDLSETGSREEDVMREFQKKATVQSQLAKEIHISDREWERMKEQQELIFDKNAPSAIIQEKGKEKERKTSGQASQTRVAHSKTMPDISSSSEAKSPEKKGKGKSPFGKGSSKKKSPSSGDLAAEAGMSRDHVSPPEPTKKKIKGKKLKKRVASSESEHAIGKGPSPSKGSIASERSKDSAVASIDDYDGGLLSSKMGQAAPAVKHSQSYEEPPLWKQEALARRQARLEEEQSLGHKIRGVNLRRTGSREDLDRERKTLDFPSIASQQHSPSYHSMELLTDDEPVFKEELRPTSKSHMDVSSSPKVELDPHLRMKKSGVVIGPSSRGSSRRPSILHSGSPDQEEGEGEEMGEAEETGEGATTDMDLSAIPKTTPSLGLQVGRARRDLAIGRSISKRRPASMRKALFLDLDESEKLSGARVTLSDNRPVRRNTMPAQHLGGKPLYKGLEKSPKEEEKPQNLILHMHKAATPARRQNSNTSTSSTAEMVARAAALRRQQSSGSSEEGSPDITRRRHTLAVTQGGFGLLAKFAGERRGVGEERRELLPRRLLDVEKLQDKLEGVKSKQSKEKVPVFSSHQPQSSASGGGGGVEDLPSQTAKPERSRRMKTVEKPVKTLGIASEEGSQQTSPVSVPLRRSPEKKGPSTSSDTPSWIAIAQQKKQRIASMVYGPTTGTEATPPLKKEAPAPAGTPASQAAVTPPSSSARQPEMSKLESSMPKQGHVRARLAMFQNPK